MPSSNFNVARSPTVPKRERDADESVDHTQKKTAFGFGLKTSTVVSICDFFYQARPKTKHTIHSFYHPQREKTRGHLAPTAEGTYKLGHKISKKEN